MNNIYEAFYKWVGIRHLVTKAMTHDILESGP